MTLPKVELVSISSIMKQSGGTKPNGSDRPYLVPLYQRNYDWTGSDVEVLIQDVLKSALDKEVLYNLGPMIVINDELPESVADQFENQDGSYYEVLDGQQRLMAVYMILCALKSLIGDDCAINTDKLTEAFGYLCRPEADAVLRDMASQLDNREEFKGGDRSLYERLMDKFHEIESILDKVILDCAKENKYGKDEIIQKLTDHLVNRTKFFRIEFSNDFQDRNRLFELMNSRGETLEQHEIIKAWLMDGLDPKLLPDFDKIWSFCSDMHNSTHLLFKKKNDIIISLIHLMGPMDSNNESLILVKIRALIDKLGEDVDQKVDSSSSNSNDNDHDSNVEVDLQGIVYDILSQAKGSVDQAPKSNKTDAAINIDVSGGDNEDAQSNRIFIKFSDFLMQTFCLYCHILGKGKGEGEAFPLDSQKMTEEFERAGLGPLSDKTNNFSLDFLLLMVFSRYLLDEYMIDYQNEFSDDQDGSRFILRFANHPIQGTEKKGEIINSPDILLKQLLSMLHATYRSPQDRHWLQAILRWLWNNINIEQKNVSSNFVSFVNSYLDFVEEMAKTYMISYLKPQDSKSKSFKELIEELLGSETETSTEDRDFLSDQILALGYYIPVFVFNYLDYLLYKRITKKDELSRLISLSDNSEVDEKWKLFEKNKKVFHFSGARNSKDHFEPCSEENDSNIQWIHGFGNLSLVTSSQNSSMGKNKGKSKTDLIEKYINNDGISLKLLLMVIYCSRENYLWGSSQAQSHYKKMIEVILDD
jgi:hypothetical protein